MADIRIKDLAVTAGSSASDDYLAVDGSTNGTRKLSAYSPTFGGAVTSSGNLTAGGDITLSTNNAFLKGKTSGGSTVNLISLTSDSITRFIAGVDAVGFQWTNQAQTAAWASLNSSLLTVTGNITVSGGSIVNGSSTSVIYFGTPSNNYLYYDGSSLYTRVGGSDRMTISGSTGNVLIGTTTDGGAKLTVNKSNGGNINGPANAAIYLPLDESSIQGPGTNTVIRMGGNLVLGGNNSLVAATSGTTALTLDSSQNATFAGTVIANKATTAFRIPTAETPASASATGTIGTITWDTSYIYVCTAANTWKRVAIATW